MTNSTRFLLLSIFSALLLSVAWYWKLTMAVFFGFVPLLIIEDRLQASAETPKRRLKLWAYSYLTFLVWNVMVTWWVVYASFGGALMAFICNALLMSIVFYIFSSVKARIGKSWAAWLLIPLWLAFEYGHTLWDLSWTWLSLGNVFAFNHYWVQWYEYTGISGGSAWVLAVNIFIFNVLKNNPGLKPLSKPVFKMAAIIIAPILLSYLLLAGRKPLAEVANRRHVVVVQPNIDPYNTKFTLDFQSQFFQFLKQVRGKITPETDYLVLPETYITEDLDEDHLDNSQPIQWFRDSLLSRFPKLKIVTGGSSYKVYRSPGEVTATARMSEGLGGYYDYFNTGLMIDRYRVQVYHKSKLVPGVERMPFPALFKPLESMAIDMGGTTGSLGLQHERSVFSDSLQRDHIAPVICYESIYSDYTGNYVRKKANLIFIITNDGWWENTPGHIQHMNYARLRAIEHRRQIARSANTGISCFIDEFGNTHQATNWWEEAVIEQPLYINNTLTFFSRFGDMLSYASITVSFLTVLLALYLRFKR